MKKYYKMTAREIIASLKLGECSVESLVKMYLDRIRRYDELNAVLEINEQALVRARELDNDNTKKQLPLFGLAILVKDNIDVAGMHTTAGSLALDNNVAKEDAPVVANLKKNGAIILGKTNMTEFANYTTDKMPPGYSSKGGQVLSAYNKNKNPSGSSSGSGVAMSAGLCSVAIGTDTSFSGLMCAGVNGVAALKAPTEKLSKTGIIPIAHTLDVVTPMTRNFKDAMLIYGAMRDEPIKIPQNLRLKGLNIAVNRCNNSLVSEDEREMKNQLIETLLQQGVKITDVVHEPTHLQRVIMNCEFKRDLEEYLKKADAGLKSLEEIVQIYKTNPETMMKYGITFLKTSLDEASGKLNEKEYLEAMTERKRMKEKLIKQIECFDACIMTGPTNIMHFVGLPSVSIPIGIGCDGMPRCLIMYGINEERLYREALTIEDFLGVDLFPENYLE